MRRLALVLAIMLPAGASAQSVVPVRPIRAQAIITAADVTLLDETIPGAVAALEDVLGKEAKVTLYAKRPILETQVGPPALVERNQLVRMMFRNGMLAISTEGRTLDRGGLGERIRVMNVDSRQIVTGAVLEDGSVEVGQP